ncbi:hypothetical protein [Aureimonas ureilytica]|uniref:hypothetical protein n=1 Tax=Aureimonas ureilytica TaxID=401562 RepID=UPI00187C6BB0|nr:hypothetical protein [Aureimonas ureilytica]
MRSSLTGSAVAEDEGRLGGLGDDPVFLDGSGHPMQGNEADIVFATASKPFNPHGDR